MSRLSIPEESSYAIDHLRFFASILLVFHHFRGSEVKAPVAIESLHDFFSVWMDRGSTGVSLFIVLSGFLFFVIANGAGGVSYWRFIRNRVLRIFPLLLFVVLLISVVARDKFGPEDILRVILLQMNVGHPFTGYWHQFFPIGPIWTIAVEFQFYMVFPFLFAIYKRQGVVWALNLFALVLIFRAALAIVYPEIYYNVYHTLLGRLDQFLIGFLIGDFYCRRSHDFFRLGSYVWLPLISLSILGLTIAINGDRGDWRHVSASFFLEGLFWGGLILAYVGFVKSSGVLSGVFAYLGKLSFSMYLLHLFVGGFVMKYFHLPPPTSLSDGFVLVVAYVFPVLIASCAVVHHGIERPFFSLKAEYLKVKNNEAFA